MDVDRVIIDGSTLDMSERQVTMTADSALNFILSDFGIPSMPRPTGR